MRNLALVRVSSIGHKTLSATLSLPPDTHVRVRKNYGVFADIGPRDGIQRCRYSESHRPDGMHRPDCERGRRDLMAHTVLSHSLASGR